MLKAVSEGLEDPNVLNGEDACENYRTLHSSPGCIMLLCYTVCILVSDPQQLHTFSSYLWEMEEVLHETPSQVFVCLRSKLGSDQISRIILDHINQPGCCKKKLSLAKTRVLNYLKIISPIALKILFSSIKVSFLTLDVVKDIVLWVFLFFVGIWTDQWLLRSPSHLVQPCNDYVFPVCDGFLHHQKSK